MRPRLVISALLASALLWASGSLTAHAAGVAGTKHNLSVSGPGPVKALTETQICVFCHTPHGAVSSPLWNRRTGAASYVVPSSANPQWTTLKSRPQNPPDGDSRLCLSCHDGTVALGAVANLGGTATTVSMQGGARVTGTGALTPSSPGYMGTDLSGHHPVSIEVNTSLINDKLLQCTNGEVSFRVCNPLPPVKLRPTVNAYGAGARTGQGVQCTSCHDPHNDPAPGSTKFLRTGTSADTTPLCTKCHFTCGSGCP